jgi:small GTP-binding protein
LDNAFKILIAGEGGVGKTTLLLKYVNDTFKDDTSITIGIQFHIKTVIVDGIEYILQLWDFGGQDHFRFILPSFVRGAKGAILLFDTTRMASLNTLDEWVKICRTEDPRLPILFCGTKIDIEEERAVSKDLAEIYCKDFGLFDYIEVSAKTGQNVEEVFTTLVRKLRD